MTDNERVIDEMIDEMCDVYALLTARINNDSEGFKAILANEDTCPVGIMLALTDMCVGLITEKAMEAGCSTSHLIRAMAMIPRVMGPEAIEKIERGY
jgi:hypothetical protein